MCTAPDRATLPTVLNLVLGLKHCEILLIVFIHEIILCLGLLHGHDAALLSCCESSERIIILILVNLVIKGCRRLTFRGCARPIRLRKEGN